MTFERRVTAMIVNKKGEPIFSDYATKVEIVDDASGEYVEVSQVCQEGFNGKISISGGEWPVLREAIEQLLAECRS